MNLENRFNRTFKNSLKHTMFKLVTSKPKIDICTKLFIICNKLLTFG